MRCGLCLSSLLVSIAGLGVVPNETTERRRAAYKEALELARSSLDAEVVSCMQEQHNYFNAVVAVSSNGSAAGRAGGVGEYADEVIAALNARGCARPSAAGLPSAERFLRDLPATLARFKEVDEETVLIVSVYEQYLVTLHYMAPLLTLLASDLRDIRQGVRGQLCELPAPDFRFRWLSSERPGYSDSVVARLVRDEAERLSPGRRLSYVEVGVFRGETAKSVLDAVAAVAAPPLIHLVDEWAGGLVGNTLSDSSVLGSVLDRFRDTNYSLLPRWAAPAARRRLLDAALAEGAEVLLHWSASAEASGNFGDGDDGVDVVFVDAGHSLPEVTEDLSSWWRKVRPGGLLVGHDFHFTDSEVPLAALTFFRAPLEIYLTDAYVWWVRKPMSVDDEQ